jgi:hypothetical protein
VRKNKVTSTVHNKEVKGYFFVLKKHTNGSKSHIFLLELIVMKKHRRNTYDKVSFIG